MYIPDSVTPIMLQPVINLICTVVITNTDGDHHGDIARLPRYWNGQDSIDRLPAAGLVAAAPGPNTYQTQTPGMSGQYEENTSVLVSTTSGIRIVEVKFRLWPAVAAAGETEPQVLADPLNDHVSGQTSQAFKIYVMDDKLRHKISTITWTVRQYHEERDALQDDFDHEIPYR